MPTFCRKALRATGADVAGTSDVKATDQPSDALNNARLMLPFLPPVLLHSHAFGPTAQKDAVSV